MKCLIANAFLAIFASSVIAADPTCRKFSCGSVSQTEGQAKVCVQGDTNLTSFSIQNCEGATTCQTTTDNWSLPGSAPQNTSCGNTISPYNWPPAPVVVAGAAVPGDFCANDAHCFNSPNVTCTNSTCASNLGLGSNCTNSKECPPAHYCSTDIAEAKVCTPTVKDGGICDTINVCQYPLNCAQPTGAANSTCWGPNVLEDGNQFLLVSPAALVNKFTEEALNDVDSTLINVPQCKTHYAIIIESNATALLLECRYGARNANQNREESMAGNNCAYSKFDKIENNTAVTGSNLAACGFNVDDKAYCPMLKGDDTVIDALDDLIKKSKLDGSKCHPLSEKTEGSQCNEFIKNVQNTTAYFRVVQSTTIAMQLNSFLVEDNDKCVADSITAAYWFGRFADSAMSYGFIGTVSVFAILMAFIY